jgi:hypothetical protein
MTDTQDIDTEFTEISVAAPVSSPKLLTASQMQSGPPIEPLKRLFLYSAEEWERFIEEWAVSSLSNKYQKVQRFAGANDKGIDIAGFTDDRLLMGVWDNYQCKHYDHALHPTDAWPEIGKILWYSFKGHYKPPRAYFFVAPRETGTTLSQLLANPAALKAELKKVWDKACRDKITGTESISLTGDFADYVECFDFSIFETKPIREVLEQHKNTPYFVPRFGGGIPARPRPDAPPEHIDATESGYVTQLLSAYADHTQKPVTDIASLKQWSKLEQHFKRQREAFYHAESLRVFVRDKVEPGTFESLQDQIYQGVVDTCDATYPDGYERVVAVTGVAQNLLIDAHPLSPSTFLQDKHGICHQLANGDRLKWTK